MITPADVLDAPGPEAVFGADPTPEDLQRAFRQAAKAVHPDRHGGSAEPWSPYIGL